MTDTPSAPAPVPGQAPQHLAGQVPLTAPSSGQSPTADPSAYVPPQPIGAPQPHWSSSLTAHKPGIVPLAPLKFGDFIDGGFGAIRRNPRTMVGLALLTALLLGTLGAAMVALGYLLGTQLASTGAPNSLLVAGGFGGLTLLYLGVIITTSALTGMLAFPVGEAVLGRKPTLGETWTRTRRMIPRLACLCLVLVVPILLTFGALVGLAIWGFSSNAPVGGVLAIVAMAAGALAAFWASIRLSFAPSSLVLEDLGVFAALRRSWKLTFGRFWRTLGVLIVAGLIASVAQQAISIGFQLVGALLGVGVASTTSGSAAQLTLMITTLGMSLAGSLVAGLLTQPFMAAVTTLLYTDARIRSEGFDLALVRAVTGAQQGRVATG
ncbi:MAG TPA: glycerophosphoryl diester phosphodiesterase membrane domain-containing protein [Pedococcus sp.]|nr:glycerophosphoryl diester phosphodiesterase membrane domain-containing protein [Pedococcus sp.]